MKVSELPLEELYARPKMTPAVEKVILLKEDFSQIQPNYCEKVCKLKCKEFEQVTLQPNPIYPLDILIIQDYRAQNQKFDKKPGDREKIHRDIIEYICQRAGFAGLSYKIVDLLKCSVTPADMLRGQPPTYTTIAKCRPYTLSEIDRLKPKVIISLATSVTKAIGYTKLSNANNRGEIVDNKLLISLHPRILGQIRQTTSNANAAWGHEFTNLLINDFRKAARLARGELVVPNVKDAVEAARERITFCKSVYQVNERMAYLRRLPANALISFDTETTGLDPMAEDAKLLMIQFGYRDPEDGVLKAIVIPLWHRMNTLYNADDVWGNVADYLVGPAKKITHNGKFDILYIWFTKGVRVRNLAFDTLKMRHSIDSGIQGNYGLKATVWDYLIETGLGGYEDLLPPLTKGKALEKADEDTEPEEETE